MLRWVIKQVFTIYAKAEDRPWIPEYDECIDRSMEEVAKMVTAPLHLENYFLNYYAAGYAYLDYAKRYAPDEVERAEIICQVSKAPAYKALGLE